MGWSWTSVAVGGSCRHHVLGHLTCGGMGRIRGHFVRKTVVVSGYTSSLSPSIQGGLSSWLSGDVPSCGREMCIGLGYVGR